MVPIRRRAADLSVEDLRQAIVLGLQGQGLTRLALQALRQGMEDRLGLARGGLNTRQHEVSDLALEMVEQG